MNDLDATIKNEYIWVKIYEDSKEDSLIVSIESGRKFNYITFNGEEFVRDDDSAS